jgi:hypothetical protein
MEGVLYRVSEEINEFCCLYKNAPICYLGCYHEKEVFLFQLFPYEGVFCNAELKYVGTFSTLPGYQEAKEKYLQNQRQYYGHQFSQFFGKWIVQNGNEEDKEKLDQAITYFYETGYLDYFNTFVFPLSFWDTFVYTTNRVLVIRNHTSS